jgi:hypothetical protein
MKYLHPILEASGSIINEATLDDPKKVFKSYMDFDRFIDRVADGYSEDDLSTRRKDEIMGEIEDLLAKGEFDKEGEVMDYFQDKARRG